jgi:heme a synthase
VGRTYAVAVRDRGKPLDVGAQKPDKHLRLCLAQLRKIRCDMRDRAVVLADLNARAGLLCRRCVAVGRERRSQFGRTAISWHLCQCRGVANFETVQALPGEPAHCGVAAGLAQIAERLDRDVVVGVSKQGVTVIGQGEQLRGAAAASELTVNLALRNFAYPPRPDQRVEVAADSCRREAETRTQGAGALGTVIVQGPGDPVPGSGVIRASGVWRHRRRIGDHRGFHNTNVTYLVLACTHPLLGRGLPSSAMTATARPSAPPAPRRSIAVAIARRPSATTVRRLALTSLIANIGIVSTGGLVRLTNSGLGCPSWPDCSSGDLVPVRAVSSHKAIEFGNRALTTLLVIAVAAVFIAIWRSAPRRAGLLRWAWVTLLGVPAQIVVGGVLIFTHLNPLAVAGHFMLSMVLIAAATVLWWRAREPADLAGTADSAAGDSKLPPLAVPPIVKRLGLATWGLTYAVFIVGTLVTGSGPHAGDATAKRLHLRPAAISQLHADLVMLLVGVAAALAVCVTAVGADALARRTTRVLIAVLAAQAAVGFAQYFSGLPVPLVELHVTGAAVLAATATAVVLSLQNARVREKTS